MLVVRASAPSILPSLHLVVSDLHLHATLPFVDAIVHPNTVYHLRDA